MVTATLLLLLLLAVGYVAHREHLRAADLQATVDDQADTAAVHLERIAELEGEVELLDSKIELLEKRHAGRGDVIAVWQDRARDERNWRVVAEAEADRNITALRGLLTNLARQEELRPDEARGVADVVELKRGRA